KMEEILEGITSEAEIKKFEKVFVDQSAKGPPSHDAQFNYAWCLIRSRNQTNIKQAIPLLEDLFHKSQDDIAKRDYLFYLAVANCKLKDFDKALKYTDAIKQVEPKNHQAHQLEDYIRKKRRTDGLIGMAAVGGAAAFGIAAVGALVGLAIAKK
ncbi:unnamed protein product, partial [Owenia fusiformis]